ncbi:MAG: hypothetical protein V4574_14695 [Pseudomonadota bacterium]
MIRRLLAAACLLAAMPAAAQSLAQSVPDLVEVRPGPKRHFYDGYGGGCPAPTAECRRAAYLVAGDQAVAIERKGGFAYVAFVNASGSTTSGWIETAALVRLDPPAPALAGWVGTWRHSEGEIEIKRSPRAGRLLVDGGATAGASDPRAVARGSVHIGLIGGEGAVVDRRLAFSMGDPDEPGAIRVTFADGQEAGSLPYDAPGGDDETFGDDRCRIRMSRLGPYLVVVDNDRCGAANVSFTGVYRRL